MLNKTKNPVYTMLLNRNTTNPLIFVESDMFIFIGCLGCLGCLGCRK